MSESTKTRTPANQVLPHELPASLRDAGLTNWIREPLDDAVDRRRRIIFPPAAAVMGTPASAYQGALLAESHHPDTIFMMGDNPALPTMPERPVLRDFFLLRFSAIARLLSANHGYWGAQMIAPYVDEEVRWAIEKHEALRYFADESVGYTYPEAYIDYFGPDYRPPDYIRREAEAARQHRWYMTSRLVTINDIYSFDPNVVADYDEFEDVVGRNFRQPREGLGFDGSPVAHMWRTMIWPNNFL